MNIPDYSHIHLPSAEEIAAVQAAIDAEIAESKRKRALLSVVVNYDAVDAVIDRLKRRGAQIAPGDIHCVIVGKLARIFYSVPRIMATCEACLKKFDTATGYYDPGEYAYCGDCCHW